MRDRLRAALADRYRLERELGAGGMATVHLAEDLKHGRKVALKVLRPELGLTADRFLQEIRVTAGLQHPNVVPLFDSGEADGLLYYVMPWIDGESLRDRLDRAGRISLSEALDVARSLATALDYAHGRGVVHRDVKPSNVLFSGGQPLLADFGIARAVDAAGHDRMTATGHSLGTPVYMSPEQATGEGEVDGRSDVYGLGCILHEMLEGEPPFSAPTFQALIVRKLTREPPTLAEAPPAVARLVRRALARRPDDRFPSAGAFARALAEALTEVGARGAGDAARGRTGAGPGGAGPRERSIVVLPLRNLSPDPDNAYFADGLTEEIITDLARLRDLRVISRTSAMRYRDSDAPLPQIARDLDVRYVLEGSVRKAGQAIRVTTQLVEARTDHHLWSEKFSGTLEDVFEIQERVSRQIVEALEVSFSGEDRDRLAARKEEDPRVLELLMRVRHEVWRFTEDGMARAEALLEQAGDLVGENPRLIAAKADLLFQTVNLGMSDDEARVDEAEALARRALAMDEGCAQAHSTLAWIVGSRRQSLGEAQRLIERAVELDPADSTAQLGLVAVASFLGRHGASDPGEVADRLVARDPLWSPSHIAVWMWATMGGDHEAALAAARRARELEPSPASAVFCGLSLLELGRRDDAAAVLEPLTTSGGEMNAWRDVGRALYHAIRDEADEARAAVTAEVVTWAEPDGQYCWHVAQVYALLGDADEALDWFERAVGNHFWNWRFLAEHERLFDGLREEPRFRALLRRAREGWESAG